MIMMINFLKSLGLLKVTIGFFLGLAVGLAFYANGAIEAEKRFKLLDRLSAEQVLARTELEKINQSLRTKRVERKNADGSTEIIEEKEKDSAIDRGMAENSTSKVERTTNISEETHTYLQQRYSLGIGYSNTAVYSVQLSVSLFGPFYGYGWLDAGRSYGVGLGFRF